jgi:hypothetical protein
MENGAIMETGTLERLTTNRTAFVSVVTYDEATLG